jgi:ABC-type uncharacterized transport system permease subunit
MGEGPFRVVAEAGFLAGWIAGVTFVYIVIGSQPWTLLKIVTACVLIAHSACAIFAVQKRARKSDEHFSTIVKTLQEKGKC